MKVKQSKQLLRSKHAELLSKLESDTSALSQENEFKYFTQMPLSEPTQKGLKKSNFLEMTTIQSQSLIHSLNGKDILGAAKTGSGKTLAFLIPLLEKLYRLNWSSLDGLGALIISPTRELALQIFETLRKVGSFHSFSAGLLIGGKDLTHEKERVNKMNILVCTPGRLLQHMDETPDFYCDNLKILVLDEADRCLDIGFQKTLNAILENLSVDRQTLLFSATQTKSVKDLARLSLKNPEYVSVHEAESSATPESLSQRHQQEIRHAVLFHKNPFETKNIGIHKQLFASSTKPFANSSQECHYFISMANRNSQRESQFLKHSAEKLVSVYLPLISLHGFDANFSGLDFPAVDWVIQLDCPEDVETYIHRVGRTARYNATGNALLFLLPSEKSFVETLAAKKVDVSSISVNPSRLRSIQQQMVMFCSKDPEIKYLGQKALISYVRSIYLQRDKSVFDASKIPVEAFAESLGLPGAPVIKFLKKGDKNAIRKKDIQVDNIDLGSDDDEIEEKPKKEDKPVTKIDKMFATKNKTVLSEHYKKLREQDGSDNDEELFDLIRKDHDVDALPTDQKVLIPSKKQLIKLKKKEIAKRGSSTKILFDDQGNSKSYVEDIAEFEQNQVIDELQAEHLSKQTDEMKNADVEDKVVSKEKKREKKLAKKIKEKSYGDSEDEGVQLKTSFTNDNDGNSEEEFEQSGNEYSDEDEKYGDWQSDAALSENENDVELEIDLDEDIVPEITKRPGEELIRKSKKSK